MKVTFPHLGNTYICVKSILDDIGIDYVIPPFNNKRALELGTRYSPEMVCLPLKINIGNFIQAHGMGADTILMAGGCGPCRFGYYSQLHREILKDAGFNMEVITLEGTDIMDLLSRIRAVVPGASKLARLPSILLRAVEIAKRADEIEMLAFRTRARECERGATDRIYGGFREKALRTAGTKNILRLLDETEAMLRSIPLDPGADPLKVGIVGEIYTGIEHFASFDIQHRLGRLGVEVDRKVTVSNWIIEHMIKKPLHLPRDMAFARAAKPWLGAMIGGHARETVGNTAIYAKSGYDGVIQLFPFSCMPEIVAESILSSVERDLDIPVLTLIIDEMTGEAGYMTRVEAFVDMLERRRESLGRRKTGRMHAGDAHGRHQEDPKGRHTGKVGCAEANLSCESEAKDIGKSEGIGSNKKEGNSQDACETGNGNEAQKGRVGHIKKAGLYLGIDVGSVSTNLVVIDSGGQITAKHYRRTGGRPIESLIEGLKAIAGQCGDAPIIGVGVTGSGRELAAVIAGADIIKNEITAHAAAAQAVVPGVRTIIEIGGQDSKIILLKDGVVCDFAMNTVCAAGTGSFLDRQAARLGVPIEEFGDLALRSASPVRIAGRCAVFAESDMIHKQQSGHSIEDIVNGLCEALVRNYLNNLAKGREIHGPVVFQGGVAANRGITAAFEKALGLELTIPKEYDVMGAFGAALIARRKMTGERNPVTRFNGFDAANRIYETRSFECSGCPGLCEVVELRTDGRVQARWGDRCGKWSSTFARPELLSVSDV